MRPACPRACLVRSLCWPGGSHALPPWPGAATEAGTKAYITMHPGARGAVVAAAARRDPALLGSWLAPSQTVRSTPWVWVSGVGMSAAASPPSLPGDDPPGGGADADERVVAAVLTGLAGSGAGTNLLVVDPADRGGASLAAVGDALASLRLEADPRARSPAVAGRASIPRSALILASKAGRLPVPDEGRKAVAWGRMGGGELAGPGGRACLHPAQCLEPIFNQTLASLNVAALDILLFDGAFEDFAPAADAEVRLARAFAWAEGQRAAGRLGAYGVAEAGGALTARPSTSTPTPPHASLARLVRLAVAAGGVGHGFRYVCVPAGREAWGAATQVPDPGVVAGGPLASPPPPSSAGGWAAAVAAAAGTATATSPLVPLTHAAAAMGVGVLLEVPGGGSPSPKPALAADARGVSAALISASRPQPEVAAVLAALTKSRLVRGAAWAEAAGVVGSSAW